MKLTQIVPHSKQRTVSKTVMGIKPATLCSPWLGMCIHTEAAKLNTPAKALLPVISVNRSIAYPVPPISSAKDVPSAIPALVHRGTLKNQLESSACPAYAAASIVESLCSRAISSEPASKGTNPRTPTARSPRLEAPTPMVVSGRCSQKWTRSKSASTVSRMYAKEVMFHALSGETPTLTMPYQVQLNIGSIGAMKANKSRQIVEGGMANFPSFASSADC
jgi:hypothetical protein